MPIVTIQLMEGRDPDRIEAMGSAVAAAIAETIDAPIGTVRVMVNEMRQHQYSVGGEPIRVVMERRAPGADGAAAGEVEDQLAVGTAASATADATTGAEAR